MPTVRMGNTACRARDSQGRVLEGSWVTKIPFFDEDPLESRVRTITHPDGLWARESSAPPAWVECDDPDLLAALVVHYGCPVGQPDDSWA